MNVTQIVSTTHNTLKLNSQKKLEHLKNFWEFLSLVSTQPFIAKPSGYITVKHRYALQKCGTATWHDSFQIGPHSFSCLAHPRTSLLYFTYSCEIDVESWHCLLRLSGHFLPELDGIAACQCTSPPTCRTSLPRSSPPYETTRRSCDAWCPLLWGPESVQLLSWPMQSVWPNQCFSKNLELPLSVWKCGNTVTGHFGSKNFNIDAFFGRPWMAMDGFDMGSHPWATGGQIPDQNHPWQQSNDATRNAEVRQYFKIFVWSRFLWCPSGTCLHRNSPTRAQDTQNWSCLSWHKLTCCSPWNHPTGPIQPASKLNWDTLLRPCCMIWVCTLLCGDSDHATRPQQSILKPNLEHWLNHQNGSIALGLLPQWVPWETRYWGI